MKLIIAGCRKFKDVSQMRHILEANINKWELKEVVCGGAEGVDTIAAGWAQSYKVPVTYFLAEWKKYGRSAGPIRNKKMAEYADQLLAIWDGSSKGTKNMIEEMSKLNKPVKIILWAPDIKKNLTEIFKALPPVKE
jgi:hypothetical protein